MKTSIPKQLQLQKLVCGSLACALLLPGLAFSQGDNEFRSNFTGTSSSNNVQWSAPGNWTRVAGEGDVPKTQNDTVKIVSLSYRQNLRVDLDDVHLKLLEYTAEDSGATTGSQYIFADGTRLLKIDTLTKKGSYMTTVANGKIDGVEQSLSMEIVNLNIETGAFHIGFGTSTNSIGGLNAFDVTGKTTVSHGASLINRGVKNRDEVANRIQLGHLDLTGTGVIILGGGGNTNGTVEVTSLSGSGVVRVSDTGGSGHIGTAGTLHVNSTSESPETFSGTLQDYRVVSQPATLTVLKTGTGTQVFSGNNNTYSGTTTINEGVLGVTNTSGSALGTGRVEVGGTGVLAGKGYIALGTRLVFADAEDEEGTPVGNTITVHAGGRIAPSAHLATPEATKLTLNGANNLGATILDMEEGSSFTFRLGAGNTSDSIHFASYHAGGLQLFVGGIDVNVLNAQVGLFNLFTFNSITGTELSQLAELLNAGSGFGGSYQATFLGSGTTLSLQVDAIPEPGQTALLLIGLAGMACWRFSKKGHQPNPSRMV